MTAMYRAVAVNAASNVLAPIFATLSAVVLARTLGVGDRGVVAAVVAPSWTACMLFTLGIPESVVRTVARHSSFNVRSLVIVAGILSMIGALTVAIALIFIGNFLPGQQVFWPIAIIGFCTVGPCMIVFTLRGVAMGMGHWSLVAAESVLFPLGRLLALLILAGWGSMSVISASAVFLFTPLVAGLLYIPTVFRLRRSTSTDSQYDLSDFLYGLKLWPSQIATVLLASMPTILMFPLAGAFETGLLAVGLTVAQVPVLLSNALRMVLFAELSDPRNDSNVAVYLGSANVATFLASLGVAGLSPFVVPVIFGDPFTAALPAIYVLCVSNVLGSPALIGGAILSARGSVAEFSASTLFTLLCVVTSGAFLTPRFGALGMALSMAVGAGVLSLLVAFLLKRHLGVAFSQAILCANGSLLVVRRRLGAYLDQKTS